MRPTLNCLLLMTLVPLLCAWPQDFLRTVDKEISPEDYQAAWGLNPKWHQAKYARNDQVQVQLIDCGVPATVLWPGDKPSFTFQFSNLGEQPLQAAGRVHIIQYETYTKPGGNVFDIGVRKLAEIGVLPIAVDLAASGWQDVTVTPDLPEIFGGYALIIDFDGQDRLFGATCVRTFKPEAKPHRFSQLTMDMGYIPALLRLGTTVNRLGLGYKPTTDADFEAWYAKETAYLDQLKAAGLTVTVEFGAGDFRHACQPLGRLRTWLDDAGRMQGGKGDLAWLPAYDADFRKLVARLLSEHGWPKGAINAVKLWNEPWNGISISGWGADDIRFREITEAMAQGVEDARQAVGADVWIGGADSSSNTFDKLLADGSYDGLKYLDFMSIHYQGTDPHTTVRALNARMKDGKPAPVAVWDTESWVANSDDRIAGVLAAMLSFGQQRVVGVNSDCMVTAYQQRKVRTADGVSQRLVLQTWSAGAAIGAFQHFVGERRFSELLFRPGLPFVMAFAGEDGSNEDGTLVVLGDMGAVFGADSVALANCRSAAEMAHRAELLPRILALPDGSAERTALEREFVAKQPFTGATLNLAADARYGLYDFYGNPVAAQDGRILVPLDARGFYLRGDGVPGSYAALVAAVCTGRLDGLSPLHLEAHDMTAPIDQHPTIRLQLTNVLNRPISGSLAVAIPGLRLEHPATVDLPANATTTVLVRVAEGAAQPSNQYPMALTFEAGADGRTVHYERMRVNWIGRGAVTVDGKLDDWAGALPQEIRVEGVQEATLTEKAWLPFQHFDESVKKGLAVGWLAYDDGHFYFAVKISDTTPHPGTLRFATRDDDEFFYPPSVTTLDGADGTSAQDFAVRWSGTVTAPAAGDYVLWVRSDDGARMWLDDQQVVDDWIGRGPTTSPAPKRTLRKGDSVRLRVEYYQGGGGGMAQIGWTIDGGKPASIPTAALRTPDDKPGLLGEYFRGRNIDDKRLAQTRVDAQVDFRNWPGDPGEAEFGKPRIITLTWPDGVRRYSYRKNPILPAGNAPDRDNVQIAFNVLPSDEKLMDDHPPGTIHGYTGYACTDYEYALNTVAPDYGGGVEIWRLRYPGMPPKHFYPREPACPLDGPARGGSMVTMHEGGTRITECALPWSEIPHVKRALDAGLPIKFSFKVNDSAGVGCMELSKDRSVARRNNAFRVDWKESWANELEFGWGK